MSQALRDGKPVLPVTTLCLFICSSQCPAYKIALPAHVTGAA